MIEVGKVLDKGAFLFSFIIGFGLSVLLFHRNYSVKKEVAMPLNEATSRVVKSDGKCYRYRVEDATCENLSKN
jgi:hypothetical protein